MTTTGQHRLPLTPRQKQQARKKKRLASLVPVLLGGTAAVIITALPSAPPARHLEASGSAVTASPVTDTSTPPRAPHRAVQPQPPPVLTYTAQQGDSLWGIAHDRCGDGNKWRSLASGNHLTRPWVLPPGKIITLTC